MTRQFVHTDTRFDHGTTPIDILFVADGRATLVASIVVHSHHIHRNLVIEAIPRLCRTLGELLDVLVPMPVDPVDPAEPPADEAPAEPAPEGAPT